MSTTGVHYLGRVKRPPHRGGVYHYASVEPLIESDDDGGKWIGPVRDAVSRFPKRGLVHWHEAPLGLQIDSVWQFGIDEHPSAERGDRAEQFQLEAPLEPIEVLDLRGESDEALLRSTIILDGIPLLPAPMARRVLLWLASGICVGPLLLKPGTTKGLWALDSPDAHRDASRMPVWRLSSKDINHVPLDGGRWFVSPRLELGSSAGVQNWTSDEQVARSILGRLRKMDPELVRAIGVTENVFREYLDHIEAGRMGSTDPAVERARADRLRGFLGAIRSDTALLAEAAEALLSTSAVRVEVERQAEGKVQALVQERQAEIDAALAEGNEQLRRLGPEVESKRAESAELDTALLAKRQELEEKVASYDQEVTARLNAIARRPEAAFAEIAIIQAILSSSLGKPIGGASTTRYTHPTASPTTAIEEMPEQTVAQLSDGAEVRSALASRAGAGNLSLHAMLGLHAMFAAGAVPVVIGSRGYDLLRAYASVVAGGRLHWVPVGSSTMEAQDLLGRFDHVSGRIHPSPSGVLNAVQDAVRSERLHLIVLEGFNRAPTEAYLSPILEAAVGGRSGDAARTIPIASSELLDNSDPYSAFARLTWPPNVLIACLPTDGTASLPVPNSVWRFLGLLDADDRDRTPILTAQGSNASLMACTELSPLLWKGCMASAEGPATPDFDNVVAMARSFALSALATADAIRVGMVLRANDLPVADITALSATTILIPRSNRGAREVEEGIRLVGAAVPGLHTILAEMQHLRG